MGLHGGSEANCGRHQAQGGSQGEGGGPGWGARKGEVAGTPSPGADPRGGGVAARCAHQAGARAADDDADVTLTASADVFKAILDNELNPTTAFMTGKLSVDGDMGMAMKLTSVLG